MTQRRDSTMHPAPAPAAAPARKDPLTQIPTHLIGGPLGAGKTSLIRALLRQKPAGERWAILVNEFGQIGLDAALLSTDQSAVSLAEVAGGCLCCVNGVPFQIGLARLLRQATPDRLFIEPSGLGHPAELLAQLCEPPWQGVLALQPGVTVLDAAALARGDALPHSQRQALPHSGLLLMNKSECLDAAARGQLAAALPAQPLRWTCHGELPLAELPGYARPTPLREPQAPLPSAAPGLSGALWRDPGQPICLADGTADGWSIGWRWHPSQRFDLQRITSWLQDLGWRRAKLVLHTPVDWYSANAVAGAPLEFKPSEWRKDSRLELIFPAPRPVEPLAEAMAACRVSPEAQ